MNRWCRPLILAVSCSKLDSSLMKSGRRHSQYCPAAAERVHCRVAGVLQALIARSERNFKHLNRRHLCSRRLKCRNPWYARMNGWKRVSWKAARWTSAFLLDAPQNVQSASGHFDVTDLPKSMLDAENSVDNKILTIDGHTLPGHRVRHKAVNPG